MKKTLTLLSLALALCLAFGACTANPENLPDSTDDSVPTGDQNTGDIDEGEVAPPEDPEDTNPVEGSDPVEVDSLVSHRHRRGLWRRCDRHRRNRRERRHHRRDRRRPQRDRRHWLGSRAKVAQAIVDAQSVNVDTVSGATLTSNAVIEAVTNALTEAGVLDSYNK